MYGFWKNKRIVLYDTLLSPEMNEHLKKMNNPTDKKTDEVINEDIKKNDSEQKEKVSFFIIFTVNCQI